MRVFQGSKFNSSNLSKPRNITKIIKRIIKTIPQDFNIGFLRLSSSWSMYPFLYDSVQVVASAIKNNTHDIIVTQLIIFSMFAFTLSVSVSLLKNIIIWVFISL